MARRRRALKFRTSVLQPLIGATEFAKCTQEGPASCNKYKWVRQRLIRTRQKRRESCENFQGLFPEKKYLPSMMVFLKNHHQSLSMKTPHKPHPLGYLKSSSNSLESSSRGKCKVLGRQSINWRHAPKRPIWALTKVLLNKLTLLIFPQLQLLQSNKPDRGQRATGNRHQHVHGGGPEEYTSQVH